LQGERFREEPQTLCTPLRAATTSEKLLLIPQLFVAEGTDRKRYRHPSIG